VTEQLTADNQTVGKSEKAPLLDVRHLVQEFAVRSVAGGSRKLQAVADVSFGVAEGETLSLVGETGCGKSSLARAILQIPKPKSGEVCFGGVDLVPLRGGKLREASRGLDVVFQDPYSSLDPRWRVADLVTEPMLLNKVGSQEERKARSDFLLEQVGLDPVVHGGRKSRELSGGQSQRVAIARALALQPRLLVCDEPVSSLDVSVQAQILNLFEVLRVEFGLSYLFITHDLAVARRISDRVAVMYLGKVVEIANGPELYDHPLHPYSAALISSIPTGRDKPNSVSRIRLSGALPSAANPPSGCRFHTRCPFAQDICSVEEPPLKVFEGSRSVACHFPLAA
jgi:oligopeptide transport system ATP-binding protein